MNSKKIVFILLTMIVATGLTTFIVNKYRKPLSSEVNSVSSNIPGTVAVSRNEDPRVSCFLKGKAELSLNSNNLIKLCGSITSSKPIECFIDADKRISTLSEIELIELCN